MQIVGNITALLLLVLTLLLFVPLVFRLVIYAFRRQHFPKKHMLATAGSAALFVGIVLYLAFFFSFDSINRNGRQVGAEATSPNGTYRANIYYELYGGAAGGVNMWVEIETLATGATHVIYYADAKDNIQMNWVDDATLSITNAGGGVARNAVLAVATDIYDEKGFACHSVRMLGKYERCLQAE